MRMGTRLAAWLSVGMLAWGGVAVALGQSGEEDEAKQAQVMERFLALLEKNPRRGTALDRVYSYHVEHGTLDAFVKGYRKRTAKAPGDGNAWLLLGLLESQRGRDAAAVDALREAETHLPDSPMPAYVLGQALVMVGQPEAAAEAFERAIARKPTRADLLEIFQALGQVHQRTRRFDKALTVWTRLEGLFPDDLRVQERIASALVDEGQFAEALPRLEALAERVKDPHRQVQLTMDAADLKVRLGRTAEALADFEGLLGRLNPDAWLYREARRKLEDVFLRNDDLAGLSSYYERWVKATPDDLDALARLGRFLALQGRSEEARGWLEKAVKLAPSKRELRLALIEQLVRQNRVREAAAQYEALAEREPNNPDTLREWGRLLLKDTTRPEAERKAAASAVWRRLAEARRDDPVAAAQVADLFRQAEMVDEAIASYEKAIALAPESPQYREYLGEYYQSLKRPDEAIAAWSGIAEGPRRTVKTLSRMAEVLAGFGHLKPAIAAADQAIALEPDDLGLRVKQAAFLRRDGRLADSLVQLDAAARLAETPEEREEVLNLQVENYQASGTLAAQIDALRRELEAGKDATVLRWLRLARLWEADRRLPEASAAVKKALALDPKSVPAWTSAARIAEAMGDLLEAANGNRRLVTLDRRARAEYLAQIAKLEARLGRRAEALQAGRDLLAAAPGRAENYQVFADLCFQLGAADEGLETLRRVVRLNPADAKVLLNLGEALARQFRTEEAIEIYWRALAKTEDIDGKLGIVAHLAELYLQRNQFDRLSARLARELNSPDQQRELAFCLSQAYTNAGDYGLARQELEGLLAANPRDTQLLKQLSQLAETEGALADAAKFQKQQNDLAPSDEGTSRLATLYVRSGDVGEAEALWEKLSAEDEDPHRVLQAIDSLLGHRKPAAALSISGRLLRKAPDDWEALYREGEALVDLDRPDEAAARFRALLELATPDDAPSSIVKARRKTSQGRPASFNWTQFWQARKFPLLMRNYAVYQVRQATGMEARNYFSGVSAAWAPEDFGEARMAALAWLHRLAEKAGQGEANLKRVREAAAGSKRDPRAHWNWYYLQMVREQMRGVYQAARDLARAAPHDPAAQWCLLNWLNSRTIPPGRYSYRPTEVGVVDVTPPLPPDEMDLVLDAYRTLRRQEPEWILPEILTNVDTELKRAKRDGDRDRLYREAAEAASDHGSLGSALNLAAERGDVDGGLALFEKFDRAPSTPSVGFFSTGGDLLARLMNARAEAKTHADITRILDHYLRAMRGRDPLARRARSRSPFYNRPYYFVWLGKEEKYTAIDFPTPNDHLDHDGIQILRNAFELLRRDDKLPLLTDHLARASSSGTDAEKVDAHLMLGYLHWWREERDEALAAFAAASKIRPGDPELVLSQAELREKGGEPAEALALVDAVEPLDQQMMQRRELLALRLAVLTGNIDRARKAAERLFGLRLESDVQMQLADQMHQLGMHELAEAVLTRARRRAGNGTTALVGLMQQYLRQGRSDLAVQVAFQVLRRGNSSTFNPYTSFYASEDEAARREAIKTLAGAGRLKAMIERLEAQAKSAPQSLPLQQNLAEYYRADGQDAKARETCERIVALRPSDVQVRYQVATQLLDAGEAEAALDHFRMILKAEPSLFRYRFDDIYRAFRQARKLDDLIAMLAQIDVRALGHPYYVVEVIQKLLKEKEPRRREQALGLVRKALEAFPESRMYVIGQVKDEGIWRLPEMYDYAREAMIPPSGETLTTPWFGLDEIIEYADDGRVIGVITRLIEIASRRNDLEGLLADIEAGLKRHPDWLGGQALRAVVLVHRGESGRALGLLGQLLDDPKAPMGGEARRLLAQELEGFEATTPLAVSLYEKVSKEADISGLAFLRYHPARRLAALYERLGRVADARALLVALARRKVTRYPALITNQRIRAMNGFVFGEQFLDSGLTADAVWAYRRLVGGREDMEAVVKVFGTTFNPPLPDDFLVKIAEGKLREARGRMGRDASPRSIRAALSAPDEAMLARALAETSEASSRRAGLDLMLEVAPKGLDRARVRSLLEEMLAPADAATRAEVLRDFARLREKAPKDVSLPVLAALVALDDGGPEAVESSLRALSEWLDGGPLTPIAPGGKASSQQQAEAAPQVALWMVARRVAPLEGRRPLAERLAARAVEAADRLPDRSWILAILGERGREAHARGDRAAAEAAWEAMLERVIATARPDEAAKTKGVPVSTPDRFRQAAQLARLAAGHGSPAPALKALREVLRGGPPVEPLKVQKDDSRSNSAGAGSDETRNALSREVEEAFASLEATWPRSGASAKEVYAMLRDVVLTEARPGEVFLYGRPLATGGVERPRSVGSLLVRWAARAGEVDDLKRRVEARRKEPKAEVPALVLLGLIGLERGDPAPARDALDALAKLLPKETSQSSAELACHVAVPALRVAEVHSAALPVVEAAAKALEGGVGEEPMAGLSLILARDHHRKSSVGGGSEGATGGLPTSVPRDVAKSTGGQATSGTQPPRGSHRSLPEAALKQYAAALDRSLGRLKGDAAAERRKENFAKVAREQLRVGLLPEALATLGLFAEATSPKKGDPPLGDVLAALARRLSALPAAERFERLKAWSLPTADHRTVRLLAGLIPGEVPPSAFGVAPVSSEGIVSTADLLIGSAPGPDALDALIIEADRAAAARVANAEALAILLRLARGRRDEAEPGLEALLAALPGKVPADPASAPTPPAWPDLLVARACLRDADPTLALIGETLAEALIDHARKVEHAPSLALLRRDLAASRFARAGGAPSAVGRDPGLALWHPASFAAPGPGAAGGPPAWWLEGRGAVRHVAGPARDLLVFACPLTGTFSFSVDATSGEAEQGHVAYGGLAFEPLRSRPIVSADDTNVVQYFGVSAGARREGKVWPLDGGEALARACRSFRPGGVDRLTVQVSPGKVRCLVNGHLFFEDDDPGPTSPWLALAAGSDHQATFGNLTLTGRPTIPRQVLLSAGDRLDGWVAGTRGESVPPRGGLGTKQGRAAGSPSEGDADPDAFDWSCRDGEIRGRRNAVATSFDPAPSRLYYHRPLLDGETIRYEYHCKPGDTDVSPGLGRLAFLLEPDGVRLRWVPDGAEEDWTGLALDNAVEAPASRRGPARLPLGADGWNAVALAIAGDRVTIDLNGVRVFEHPLEPGHSRQFGLVHDKNRGEARVRRVVLSGPWPESLAGDRIANLAVPRAEPKPADLKARDTLVGEVAAIPNREAEPTAAAPKVDDWTPVVFDKTRALVFDRPILGDFEASGQIAPGTEAVEIAYGGLGFRLEPDRARYRWTRGERGDEGMLDPPAKGADGWVDVRLVVKGREATYFLDGRKVHAERLPSRPDPWLAVRGLDARGGGVRRLKVEGRPDIPERLEISHLSGMAGWLDMRGGGPSEDDEREPRPWSWRGDELVGRSSPDVPGSRLEGLLAYRRPLLEDGEIAYEFFAEPGARMVHPALGRSAFLLGPEGVVVHRLGDDGEGPAERDQPRGARLPWKESAWNRLTLTVSRGTLSIRVNDEPVLERPAPPADERLFGLFHFSDESEARVRHITYRGEWTRTLPDRGEAHSGDRTGTAPRTGAE